MTENEYYNHMHEELFFDRGSKYFIGKGIVFSTNGDEKLILKTEYWRRPYIICKNNLKLIIDLNI